MLWWNNCQDHISTHSLTRRLTLIFTYWPTLLLHFNSQPHEEADQGTDHGNHCIRISTHSLTRRLTSGCNEENLCLIHFNSQPHEEADV